MKSFDNYVSDHLSILKDSCIEKSIHKLVNRILAAINTDIIIYTVGNGGSYTTAEHFSADLNLTFQRCGQRIRSYCIGSQLATQTALSNDQSYEKALSLQLENSLRSNDVLITFSASGNSVNIIESIRCAKNLGVHTYSFTGFDGGEVLKINDIEKIHIESTVGKYGEIENIHLMICHYIVDEIANSLI